jgi:hypothetical protein
MFKSKMVSMMLRDSTLKSIAPNVNAPLKEDGSYTYYLGVRRKGSCVGGHSECGAWNEQLPHHFLHMLRMSPLVCFFPWQFCMFFFTNVLGIFFVNVNSTNFTAFIKKSSRFWYHKFEKEIMLVVLWTWRKTCYFWLPNFNTMFLYEVPTSNTKQTI